MTATINLLPNTIAVVAGAHLFEGEEFIVYRKACTGCEIGEDKWERYMPDGVVVKLTASYNPVVIRLPGEYKVEPYGEANCDAVVCYDIYNTCCGG